MAQPKSKTPGPVVISPGGAKPKTNATRRGAPPRWGKHGKFGAAAHAPGPGYGGTARASQTVSTYGPGALMDLLTEAVLVGGLDFWHYRDESDESFIKEPRLRDVIAERFFVERKVILSEDRAFRRPPVAEEREVTRAQGVEVLQFPAWFVCQLCRALVNNVDLQDQRQAPFKHHCERGGPGRCVPVRFVLACRHGHIEEFRWVHFVHEGQQQSRCAGPSMRLEEGGSGDVSDILVRCFSCSAPPRPLVRAYAPNANGICNGGRLWLGRDSNVECKEPLRLLSRSASNGYFAQVVSGLSIPDSTRALHDVVSSNFTTVGAAETCADLPVIRRQTGSLLKGFSDTEVMETIRNIRAGERPTPEPVRTAEWRALTGVPVERPGDMPAPNDKFFARAVSPARPRPPFVTSVVLVSRLREVRVQVGFTRLEPPTADLQGDFDLGVTSAALGLHTNWLPATEVRGEGIFVQLAEPAVLEWEARPEVRKRERELERGFVAWRRHQAESLGITVDKLPELRFPGARFYLLHSLSHLLMNALALECGYSASALAERIYCSESRGAQPGLPGMEGIAGMAGRAGMAGILINTGTPGAEGTLGGLVEQGRLMDRHFRRAVELGSLCSHDPVCAAHSPADDIAERHLEGAACHGCLFIAECSCERFNQYLDRALVVPTVGREGLAFLPPNW